MSASDAPEFELAGITVEAKRPDWESKLSPGTVTVIRPEEYKGEQKDLPDLLKMVPGVHVREVNGKGQYTVVNVRGSTAAQVGVFVDGVMTNLGGDAAVDISTIPVKNVERIEVYRGYIPARFGGTFIGGVINVVTKKPTKANISAELGKASFGGKSASLEVVSPLASGSLLVGLNYEAAKGDFPYHNYAMDSDKVQEYYQKNYDSAVSSVELYTKQTDVDIFNKTNIDRLYNNGKGEISKDVYDQFVDSSGQVDSGEWLDFVRSGGLVEAEIEYAKEKGRKDVNTAWKEEYADQKLLDEAYQYYCVTNYDIYVKKGGAGYKKPFAKAVEKRKTLLEKGIDNLTDDEKAALSQQESTIERMLKGKLENSWNQNSTPFFTDNPDAKAHVDDKIYEEVDKKIAETIEGIKNTASAIKDSNDTDGSVYKKLQYQLVDAKERLERAKALEKAKAERHRKYNDRKNISSLIKWQNDNWMVKASYNHINRHLPDSVWGMEKLPFTGYDVGAAADVYDQCWADSKKQILDTYNLMLQNRQQNGRLEWGWFVDYQHQKKKYRAENKLYYPWDEAGKYIPWESGATENFWRYSVLREWSEYTSNKYNLQMDGSYKLSDRQMLEFQANYSYEQLKINGSNMDKALNDTSPDAQNLSLSSAWQIRNRYEQKILNIQVQDTITLDKKNTWFLTPSWKFNSSTIVGHSEGKNFYNKPDGSSSAFKWYHPRDSQRDRKGTWQLALKKNINDNLTFRMTGGTYYRLLNMYEIAGDGAGILPMPMKGWDKAAFPRPEYGKQFDFSTLWNGNLFHSEAYATVTYFWRNTERMLMLRRASKDFWSYDNDSRGNVHGFELQAGLKWSHFSLDADATYTNISAEKKNSKLVPGGDDKWYATNVTYQPKWEANVRASWFPTSKFTLFSEVHHVGSFYTAEYALDATKLNDIDRGYPRQSVTTINGGMKLKPSTNWQITLGCNDIFNQNPKMKIPLGGGAYVNPDFPMQGRTYYASIRYEF